MNGFQPFRYLKKYAGLVVAFFAFLTVALYMILRSRQTYTAMMVIDYIYKKAENGQAPDGSKLDVSQIYSSSAINQALNNLGMDQSRYSVDSIRAGIQVQQIEDESISAINKALNEKGETSELQPTQYVVTYTVGADSSGYMARTVLDELMDVYFSQFSAKYINIASVSNNISAINETRYDYLEQAELIENALETAITNISDRAKSDPDFYSSDTGLSFNELKDKFALLRDTELSSLYAYILRHRVTKDRETLLEKYRQRVQAYQLDQKSDKVRIDEVEGVLKAYVEKQRVSQMNADVGNLYNNSAVIDDVEDPEYSADQTIEYEQLLQNWINISDDSNNSAIAAGYSQYIIDCFNGNTDAVLAYQRRVAQLVKEADADVLMGVESKYVDVLEIQNQFSSEVYTEGTVPCTEQDKEYVEQKLADLIDEMNELYKVTAETNAEYNEYLGANYIRVLSSNHVYSGLNVGLYTAVGAFLFLVVGCCGVILLGRVGDILEYTGFTDHQYRMPNRAACDRFIQRHIEKVLPPDFGCIFLQNVNQNELNEKFGRKETDELLNFFASSLKNIFPKKEDVFVGYNGSGQFLIFLEKTTQEDMKDKVEYLHVILNDHYMDKKLLFKYVAGYALSAQTDRHQIRELLGKAVREKKAFQAGC